MNMRSGGSSGADRISSLPCDLLQKILGCLSLDDAVRTSVLSTKWSYSIYMSSMEELELGGSSVEKYNVDEVSSTGYLITSCPKLQELTIECGVVGIAVESICYTILTSQINLVWCCEAVHYFIGFEMEMEFVKLILASTPALKEIFDG
uniref:F-box domain-containing protein n=1 Tax=Solanum tuberosum TaxID=4113 RepID=M1BA53_SOLTU